MRAFIDEHRERFGVEPICRVAGVSASAYCHRASGERPRRRLEDERLLEVDLVISSLAIHRLSPRQKRRLFSRIQDALAPGGRFVLANVVRVARADDAGRRDLTRRAGRPSAL